MKLVVVTQRVDPDDEALGATVAKLRALAERVDELVVIALVVADNDLPRNVRTVELGAGARAARGARLAAALARELVPRPAAVLAHMSPIYAVLSAPLARPLGVPVLLWFTHWRASPLLRLALTVSDVVLTADRVSFPFDSSKVVPLGHGVDLDELPVVARPDDGALRLLALGRTSAAKGLGTVLAAVAELRDPRVTLEVRGPSLTPDEVRHREELQRLAVELGVGDRVAIEAPVPRGRIAEVYAGADALVNNMRVGALDKVVYEAAGSALPVLVASPGFDDLVGGLEPPLRFAQDDVSSLAAAIAGLASLTASERRLLGDELRRRTAELHSTAHWADGILEAAGHGRRAGGRGWRRRAARARSRT